MTPTTTSQISELRARTGAGVLDVKQALDEAKGDSEKAIEILRKKGQAQAVKKASRDQGEGAIFVATGGRKAALVMIGCETDFVARSDAFLALGRELADTLLKTGESGFNALSKEKIDAAVLRLGENISVSDVNVLEAPVIGTYVHSNRKIGVIVGLSGGTEEQATDAAMHAAAMNPGYVRPDDVPADVIRKEREIWKEQMSSEKKTAEVLEKIAFGKEKKFREENALTTQPFVKDPSVTVGKMLGEAKVVQYVRVSLA